jgi:hypothetical protein
VDAEVLVSYKMSKNWRKSISSNNLLTLQICEQKNEKKNRMGIEFVVFFSHTVTDSKLRKKVPFLKVNL